METPKFVISATYYYYAGTHNAPKSGPMVDPDWGTRLRFDTKQDALNFLFGEHDPVECCDIPAKQGEHYEIAKGGAYYSTAGGDGFHYGEFESPDYRIRRERKA